MQRRHESVWPVLETLVWSYFWTQGSRVSLLTLRAIAWSKMDATGV